MKRRRSSRRRKVCVVTGGRQDYGLLKPLMLEISKDKGLKLQVIATCMHLSAEFGSTYRQIEDDGFEIDERVRLDLSSDTPVGISRAIGMGVPGFAKAYERLKPDIVIILGDRFELLATASAALVSRIPIAHIHGGELTEAAFDEAIRHAITKMSHIHFTAAEEYRNRVIQLGEDPRTVFNVGALGIDNIKRLRLLSRRELEKELGINFDKRNLLVTFHPVTLEDNTSREQLKALLDVLEGQKETFLIFTRANADTHGKVINRMLERYVSLHPDRAKLFSYLGQLRYLSAMRLVDGVVGNSSSGIIEAPSFRVGIINIGDRERGRIRTKSIIDCAPTRNAIKGAIKKLYSPSFKRQLKSVRSPYGNGRAARRIVKIIKDFPSEGITKKRFYDIMTGKI